MKNNLYNFINLALFGCLQIPVAQAALSEKQEEAISRFAKKIQTDVIADDVGSIAAAVVIGDEVVWAEAFGWADKREKIKADRQTIYRTGSISKSVTAVLMMRLVEEGVLNLDDPVEAYFPEIKKLNGYSGETPITFRQLASHTAGLIREPMLRYAATGPIAEWEDKVLASIPKTSFFAPPGKAYQYSNIGYGILGLAISRAAKKPFMDLVHTFVFEPLDMDSSFFIVNSATEKRLSVGYENRPKRANGTRGPKKGHEGRGYKVPNGGVYSTVDDLARFIAAQTGSKQFFQHRETREEMQNFQTPESSGRGYGLGFFIIDTESGIRVIEHGGVITGYTASIFFDQKSKIGVILLRNYNQGNTNLKGHAGKLLIELAQADKK